MKNIGDSIYLLRLERKMSQKDLALRSGVPQPNISKIEKGRDFQISTLCKIAFALEISPAELVAGIQPIPVDRKKFFERNNIEKFVNNPAVTHKNASAEQLSKTLHVALSDSSSRKDLHLSWIKLKRTFTREELNTLFNRLNKAKDRAS